MKGDVTVDPSDSAAQRSIEVAILERVTDENPDWTRAPWIDVATKYRLPAVWRKAKPDAVWETQSGELIVGECYTRVETLKPGNYGKLAKDTLKLLGIRNALAGKVTVRCLMIMPNELAKQLQGGGWLVTSLRQAVEIVPVSLLDAELISLKAAALAQSDGQSRARRKSELSK